MNGVKRSVTPEAFSAGTTAKVISGYFAFQSSAEADAVNENAAIPARTSRRLIMMHLRLLVVVLFHNNAPSLARGVRPERVRRVPERLSRPTRLPVCP